MHCATLAQIAANSTAYLEPAANITLVLEQGHHQLDSELTISNVGGLLITSENSTFDTPSVSIKLARFSNIRWLRISNINFTHSGSITVESVQNLFIENSIFLESNGTALKLINTTASIVSSSFIFNSLGTYKGPFETVTYKTVTVFALVGGAVIVSESSVVIFSTLFEGNYAEFGGAVYSELNSQLSVIKSNFTGNEAKAGGGALYIVKGCHVTITDSNYQNNRAVEEQSSGGALGVYHSTILINNSTFTHNMANSFGGAICIALNTNLTISASKFYYNAARRIIMEMLCSHLNRK